MVAAKNGLPGPGVDASGRSVMDPTANVVAILQSAVQRQDDLREQEASHIREIMTLRAQFSDDLRLAESARIDAIRAVDVAAVQRAAEVAAAAVQALATQVPIVAEAARASLGVALDPIQKDIAELRKVQYEQQGQRTAVTETKTERNAVVAQVWIAMGVLSSIAAGFIGHLLK
jgi:hypothetical protein